MFGLETALYIGVALLELVWPCWRKYVSVEVDIEAFLLSPFCFLLLNKDVELSGPPAPCLSGAAVILPEPLNL